MTSPLDAVLAATTLVAPAASSTLQSHAAAHVLDDATTALLHVGSAVDPLAAERGLRMLAGLRGLGAPRECETVLHPSFRYWLQALKRFDGTNPEATTEFLNAVPSLVWGTPEIARTIDVPVSMRLDDRGGMRVVGRARYLELGPSYANRQMMLHADGDEVVIVAEDGLTVRIPLDDLGGELAEPAPTLADQGYEIAPAPRVGPLGIEASTRDPWLRVHLTGTNQRTDGTEFYGASGDLYESAPDLSPIADGLSLLHEIWPEASQEIATFTKTIVPLHLPPTKHRAFTVSSRQGAIYIGPAPQDTMIEMLLHENAHVKMRQLQLFDDLLLDFMDETLRVPVPWRPDPRPLPGILEGLFVFSHVAEFERRRLLADPRHTPERLVKLVGDLSAAVRVLEKHGRFTANGEQFFATLVVWGERLGCAADPLPARA